MGKKSSNRVVDMTDPAFSSSESFSDEDTTKLLPQHRPRSTGKKQKNLREMRNTAAIAAAIASETEQESEPHEVAEPAPDLRACTLLYTELDPMLVDPEVILKDGQFNIEDGMRTIQRNNMYHDRAYIRFKNKLYYYDLQQKQLRCFSHLPESSLRLFDEKLQNHAISEVSTGLTPAQMAAITELTGHPLVAIHPIEDPKIIDEEETLKPKETSDAKWQRKNGVDLFWVTVSPSDEQGIEHSFQQYLPRFSNAAYFRYKNELWYVKRKKPLPYITNPINTKYDPKDYQHTRIQLSAEQLGHFDAITEGYKKIPGEQITLSDKQLDAIGPMTKNIHRTRWQRLLSGFGYFCAAAMAVSCGVSTAGTFFLLHLTTGGLATAGAVLIFIAGTAVNWWIFRNYVPDTLIDLLGRKRFLMDEEGKPLSKRKVASITIAGLLSLSVGITFAALANGSTYALIGGLGLALGPALPALAGFLAAITFICMTALQLKDIAELIKKKDVWGECKNFLKNLFDVDTKSEKNQGKGKIRCWFECILTVLLTATFIPLACVGTYMTMNACAPGVKAFLTTQIPKLSAHIAGAIAAAVSLGFAFLGQLPFVIKVAFATGVKIVNNLSASMTQFSTWLKTKPQETMADTRPLLARWGDTAWTMVKLANVLVNAIGNGLISFLGSTGSALLRITALISGTANSAFAGVPNALPGSSADALAAAKGREISFSKAIMEANKQPEPMPDLAPPQDNHPRTSNAHAELLSSTPVPPPPPLPIMNGNGNHSHPATLFGDREKHRDQNGTRTRRRRTPRNDKTPLRLKDTDLSTARSHLRRRGMNGGKRSD